MSSVWDPSLTEPSWYRLVYEENIGRAHRRHCSAAGGIRSVFSGSPAQQMYCRMMSTVHIMSMATHLSAVFKLLQ
jgi:hypothetical protein